jgi:hypothetical protein
MRKAEAAQSQAIKSSAPRKFIPNSRDKDIDTIKMQMLRIHKAASAAAP